jgi:fatty acid desaturase
VHHCWSHGLLLQGVLAMWAHGTVGSTFVYGCHELGHGTVFQTKALNTAFLYVYSVLFWWEPFDYAASHTYHHRYSQYPEGDRENLFPLTPSLDPWLLLELFTVNVTSGCGRVFGKGGLVIHAHVLQSHALYGYFSGLRMLLLPWLRSRPSNSPSRQRWGESPPSPTPSR